MDRRMPISPRHDTGYWKTRVERVLDLQVVIPPGNSTYRRLRTAEQMQRTESLDADDGRVFLRVDVAGELTCTVKVWWEVPGSLFEYELDTSRTTVTLGEVAEILLWSGPTPGLEAMEFVFANAGGSVPASIVADLCAKRRGGRFMRRHWFRDFTGRRAAPMRSVRYDPDPDGKRKKPRPPKSPPCNRPWLAASTEGIQDALRALRRIPIRGSGSGGPVPGSSPEPVVRTCERADSAQDWALDIDSPGAWSVTNADGSTTVYVPDPEAYFNAAYLGQRFQLGLPTSGRTVTFPFTSAFPAGHTVTVDAPWVYLGRCEGFDELWEEVTGGLDRKRLSQYKLCQVLTWTNDNPYLDDFELYRLHTKALLFDPEDDIDTEWNWGTAAPWATHSFTWTCAALWNLLAATFENLPPTIRSERDGTDAWLLDAARVINRFTTVGDPNFEFVVVGLDDWDGLQGAFSLASGTWADQPLWSESIPFRGETDNGYSWWPIPTVVALHAHQLLPFVESASKCYAAARQLTMLAARHRIELSAGQIIADDGTPVHGTAYDVVLQQARRQYTRYVGSLLHPGKTLVHELFHTDITDLSRLDTLLAEDAWAALTEHCSTGCGQEKMSSSWVARVAARVGAPYPSSYTTSKHPSGFRFGVSISNSSECVHPPADGTVIVTSADEAASVYGGSVELAWMIAELGVSSKVTWWPEYDEVKDLDTVVSSYNVVIEETEAALITLRQRYTQEMTAAAAETDPVAAASMYAKAELTEAEIAIAEAWLKYVRGTARRATKQIRTAMQQAFRTQCWGPTDSTRSCKGSGSCG